MVSAAYESGAQVRHCADDAVVDNGDFGDAARKTVKAVLDGDDDVDDNRQRFAELQTGHDLSYLEESGHGNPNCCVAAVKVPVATLV